VGWEGGRAVFITADAGGEVSVGEGVAPPVGPTPTPALSCHFTCQKTIRASELSPLRLISKFEPETALAGPTRQREMDGQVYGHEASDCADREASYTYTVVYVYVYAPYTWLAVCTP
jgi:hypothetical protein